MPEQQSKKRDIPSALENFDRLPNTANVRQPVVEALTAVVAQPSGGA
jgi:hypothetical protein